MSEYMHVRMCLCLCVHEGFAYICLCVLCPYLSVHLSINACLCLYVSMHIVGRGVCDGVCMSQGYR